MLSLLSPSQARVISLRYGLDGTEPFTLTDGPWLPAPPARTSRTRLILAGSGLAVCALAAAARFKAGAQLVRQ